jgi:SAM-dependent methyltransferase
MNSPIESVEALKPYIKGKIFCDLGCGDGEFLKEVSKYTTVTGIENDPKRFEECKSKGLNIVLGDHRHDIWPVANVYYSYPFWHDVPIMMFRIPSDAILIIGSDTDKFRQGDFPKELTSQKVIDFSPTWRIAIWHK